MRDDGITLVFLSRGKVAVIDSVDAECVLAHTWYANTQGYAARNRPRRAGAPRGVIFLHRIIAGTPDGMETDHRNGRILDNRRCNLRVANQSQNQANRKRQRTNAAGFVGVTWLDKSGAWRASIMVAKKQRHIGLFSTAEDAAHARDRVAREVFGEFAKLNFPDDR